MRGHPRDIPLCRQVRRRLVLENDERCYSVSDLLPLCQRCEIPLVYDTLHGAINGPNHLGATRAQFLDRLLPDILMTWRNRGLVPKFHVSTQLQNGRTGAHADYIDELPDFLLGITDPLDIMIEAKMKELAVVKLLQQASLRHIDCTGLPPRRAIQCGPEAVPSSTLAPCTSAVKAFPSPRGFTLFDDDDDPKPQSPPDGAYRHMVPFWRVVDDERPDATSDDEVCWCLPMRAYQNCVTRRRTSRPRMKGRHDRPLDRGKAPEDVEAPLGEKVST